MTAETFVDDNWYRMDRESRDAYREQERKAMSPEVLKQRHLDAYREQHQARVLAIRHEAADDVQERVSSLDQAELGRRLVAWMINREIDRRTLARLPGEAYGALMYSGAMDARGTWHYDAELREMTEGIFPESRAKPMTLRHQEQE